MTRFLALILFVVAMGGCRVPSQPAPRYKTVSYEPSDKRPRAAILRATDYAIHMQALRRRDPQYEVTGAIFNPNNAEWSVHFQRKPALDQHKGTDPADRFTVKIDTYGNMELWRNKQ